MKTDKMTDADKQNVRLFACMLVLFGGTGVAAALVGWRYALAAFCSYWVVMGAIALWELRE